MILQGSMSGSMSGSVRRLRAFRLVPQPKVWPDTDSGDPREYGGPFVTALHVDASLHNKAGRGTLRISESDDDGGHG